MANTPSGRVSGDDGGGIASGATPVEVERRWRDGGVRTPRRCIVVTGMHRSGTSAVAGALCAAGAWAGPEADLLPASLRKPRGRYERRAASDALEAELVNRGGSWSNPPLTQLQPWAQEQLRPTLRSVFSAATLDVPRGAVPLVKDPRLCLFAAELRTLLLDSWSVVLAVRHPLEVARSLHDHDGLSIQAGLALWEIYNQSICIGLAGRPVHVVRYDALLDDAGTAARLVDQVVGDGEPVPQSAQDRVAAQLSRELRQHRADVADEDRWLSVAALRLWHQLESASQALEATTLPVVEMSYGAPQHIRLEATCRRLEAETTEYTERLERLNEDVADLANLQSEVSALRAANKTLTVDVASAAERLATAEQRLAEAQSVVAVNEGLAGQVDELTRANQGLTRLVKETADLRAKALDGWAESARECKRLAATSDQREKQYQADVRGMLVELDTAIGEVEAARSAYAEARDSADASIATASALAEALRETSAELARIDVHRRQLIEDINAICGSESWRIGHAITWPMRILRRSPRREDEQLDQLS